MKKILNRRAWIAVLLTFVLVVSTNVLSFSLKMADAVNVKALSLFETRDSVDIVLNQKSHPSDPQTGVMLSTSQNGAEVRVRDTLTGVFDFEYKVFSAQTVNVSKIVVSVMDTSGNTFFDYVAENHSDMQVKSYLQKGGAAVSNSIMTESSFFGTEHGGIRLGFDQADGSITVNGSAYSHGLKDFKDLAEYKISLSFVDVDGKANVLLYRLMGQSLQGSVLKNDAAPSLYVEEMPYNGIVGKELNLPLFSVYDVIDKNEYAGYSIRVMKPNALITLQQQEFSFVPDVSGIYKALYTVKDSGGLKKTATLDFEVFEESQIVHDVILENKITESDSVIVGKDTKFIFPAAEFSSNYARSGRMKAELTVDGNKYDAGSPIEYTFEEIGSFTAKYSLKEAAPGNPDYSIRFDVVDGPAFVYPKLNILYSRGEVLDIPALTASYGGGALPATHKLYLPDGSVDTQSNAVLQYSGEYRLEYRTTHNETDYYANVFFKVDIDIKTLITDAKDVTYRANVNSPFYADSYNGIELTSKKKGGSFAYGNTIDFSGKTQNDTLLEFLVTPAVQGVADISSLTIRFTDVVDPNNYISVIISGMYDSPVYSAYLHSSLSFASSGTNTFYANRWGQITSLGNLGTASITSFHGVGYNGNKVKSAKLSIDYADRAIYVLGDKVLDLDDPLHVGGTGKEWNGFFSDKATVTVTFNGEGSILLLNVDGQSLSGDTYADGSETEIFVNCNAGEEPTGLIGIPYAVLGAYTQSAFNGTAFDYDVRAFRNYGIAGAKEYEINNGKFTPDVAGTYTLVYSAGSAKKTVNITVAQTLSPLDLSIDDSFFNKDFYTGEEISLPAAGITGGSNYGYSVLITSTIAVNQSVVMNRRFTPVEPGQYTIRYTVTDYIGNTSYLEKILNVVLRNAPYFIGQPNINNGIMLSGAEYTLPVFGAYEFIEGGTVAVQTKIGIKQDSGIINWLEADRKYNDSSADDNTITVVYRAISLQDNTNYTDMEIPVIVLKPKNFSEYFYGGGVRRSAAGDYIRLESDNDAEAYFVNALPAAYFNFDYSLPEAANGIGGITFTLTDSENPAISISFGLFKTEGNAEFYLNGKFYKKERVPLNGNWTVRFNRFVNTLENSSGIVYASLKNTLGGGQFNGFPSQKILLSVKLESVSGSGFVNIQQLCGQALTSDFYDRADPIISYTGIVKAVKYNEWLQIPKTIVADVIDPNATGTIRLTSPDGTVLLNNVAIEQSYSVQLTMYGKYSLKITIEDLSGNSITRILTVTVRDDIAPELTVNRTLSETGKTGQRIEIPSATATDNVDLSLKIEVYVIAPDGTIQRLSDLTGFVPKTAGVYRVRYYVQDSYLNYDMKTFVITVE